TSTDRSARRGASAISPPASRGRSAIPSACANSRWERRRRSARSSRSTGAPPRRASRRRRRRLTIRRERLLYRSFGTRPLFRSIRMSSTTIVVLADPKGGEESLGRLFNALAAVHDFKQKQRDVRLVFQGAGTRWPGVLARPDHPAHALYAAVAD